MMDRVDQTEWCDRVRAAIVDGRILEDPGHWRPHVERCEVCRGRVEGLLTLRRLVERARLEAPIVERTPEERTRTLQAAFERFHRHRRGQWMAGCVVALLAAGAGTFAITRPRAVVETAQDSIAHAERLHRRVFPASGRADLDALREDPKLRMEYVRALDDPSSLVRRTALTALALSGVEIDADRLDSVLRDWSETLDSPVELASADDGASALRAALTVRRTATLDAALLGAMSQAARGESRVPSSTLVRLLRDSSPEVRRRALMALAADPSFVPGEEVTAILLRDTDVGARVEAAACLIARGGASGAAAVVAHLRAVLDYDVEEQSLALLGATPDVVALARARLASDATPIRLALWHELTLVRAGERALPPALAKRALAADSTTVETLATVAAEADWTSLRPELQQAWRGRAVEARRSLGRILARWDARSADPARLAWALDICDAQRDAKLRDIVTALARSDAREIRERAQALLRDWPVK